MLVCSGGVVFLHELARIIHELNWIISEKFVLIRVRKLWLRNEKTGGSYISTMVMAWEAQTEMQLWQ